MKAAKLLTEAAALDHIEAIYNLGICYHYGYGTEIDFRMTRVKASYRQARNFLEKYFPDYLDVPVLFVIPYIRCLIIMSGRHYTGVV